MKTVLADAALALAALSRGNIDLDEAVAVTAADSVDEPLMITMHEPCDIVLEAHRKLLPLSKTFEVSRHELRKCVSGLSPKTASVVQHQIHRRKQ